MNNKIILSFPTWETVKELNSFHTIVPLAPAVELLLE